MDDYRKVVLKTSRRIHPDDRLTRIAFGLTKNAGDFAGFIDSMEFKHQKMDRENMLKTLGDVLWYVELATLMLGVTREEVEQINIDKLKLQVPEDFAIVAKAEEKEQDETPESED